MKTSTKFAIASVAAGALLLTACGDDSDDDGDNTSGGGGAGGGEESVESSGTLSFYTDKAAWEPQFDRVSEVSEDEIGFDLDFTGYSDSDAYTAFIKQSFRTDEKPTLFTWHTGDKLGELVDEGLVAPTSEIWSEAISNGDIPADLEQYYTYDGEQYCVPLHVSYWVMYYNTHVFDEHGLQPPQTWDDLINIADTLAAEGVPAFYQTNILFSFVWFQTLLAGSDPDLYEALATGEASYTDPGVVAAMEQWREMMEAGYFSDPGAADDPQVLLNNGDVAMLNFGTFFTGALNELGMVSGEDYDLFVIPNVDPSLEQTSLIVESGPLCAAEEADDRAEALNYFDWWVTADAQSAWADARGDVSFNPGAEVNDERLADLGEQAGSDDVRLIERYFEATPPSVLTVALDEFGAFVTNPGDPMPHLEAIQAEAEAHWANQ
ncbi:ABC transporter substrate-binding protein [Phytoactinopolyspora halotolerans]|uniref:Carbohydrate ABC transporter substrate-binding protein n=1 Tax=Phytoactinopolyspora halotolerans TaxID=1981512 RepID=A0A6L9S171_9ACTN|nr:ABC transporter substrate-binding protein [Phytoactinopolyspora halotolerans]NED98728.1 carbohydrate ABC transporter substrate-binding protein [Phytoactinopolyspora halotolerans]